MAGSVVVGSGIGTTGAGGGGVGNAGAGAGAAGVGDGAAGAGGVVASTNASTWQPMVPQAVANSLSIAWDILTPTLRGPIEPETTLMTAPSDALQIGLPL